MTTPIPSNDCSQIAPQSPDNVDPGGNDGLFQTAIQEAKTDQPQSPDTETSADAPDAPKKATTQNDSENSPVTAKVNQDQAQVVINATAHTGPVTGTGTETITDGNGDFKGIINVKPSKNISFGGFFDNKDGQAPQAGIMGQVKSGKLEENIQETIPFQGASDTKLTEQYNFNKQFTLGGNVDIKNGSLASEGLTEKVQTKHVDATFAESFKNGRPSGINGSLTLKIGDGAVGGSINTSTKEVRVFADVTPDQVGKGIEKAVKKISHLF